MRDDLGITAGSFPITRRLIAETGTVVAMAGETFRPSDDRDGMRCHTRTATRTAASHESTGRGQACAREGIEPVFALAGMASAPYVADLTFTAGSSSAIRRFCSSVRAVSCWAAH
jgi:hypothetical protein